MPKWLARDLKRKYIKRRARQNCGVIAIDLKYGYWWHVDDNEKLPKDYLIAIHSRKRKIRKAHKPNNGSERSIW